MITGVLYSLVIVWLFMRATSLVVSSRPPGSFVGCDRHIFRCYLGLCTTNLTMLYSAGLLSLAFQGGAAFTAGASKLSASAVVTESRVGLARMDGLNMWDMKEISPDGKLVQRVEGNNTRSTTWPRTACKLH